MAQLNPCLVLQLTQGFPVKVVNAATTTGTSKSSPFAVQMRVGTEKRIIEFTCTGTYTVATLTLQQSMDGGNTFQSVGTAMDFFADKGGDLALINSMVSFVTGVIYQLSVTSLTGTSITVTLAIG